MYSLQVKDVMDPDRVLMLPPDATVSEAAQRMGAMNVGAVMVAENQRLLGIFTERDALFRVIAPGKNPCQTLLKDVMTSNPLTVAPHQSYGYALLVMFEGGFRHAPVVVDGKPVGIVSARNAMDPALEEFASETHRRECLRSEAGPGS